MTVPRHKRRAERRTQATQQQALGICPECGKRAYTSKATAKAAARRLYPGARIRAYSCPGTPWWHLTSQDAERTARMRDQQAARPERSRT
jgi:negative regulator of replication initiation